MSRSSRLSVSFKTRFSSKSNLPTFRHSHYTRALSTNPSLSVSLSHHHKETLHASSCSAFSTSSSSSPIPVVSTSTSTNAKSLPPLRIAFIGGGKCATALINGIVNTNILTDGSSIIVADPSQSQLDILSDFVLGNYAARSANAKPFDLKTTTSNIDCVHGADMVFLAVKPQTMTAVLRELTDIWTSKELIVTIAAGVKLAQIESCVAPQQRVIRMMPNTPALIGEMAAGITAGANATDEDMDLLCAVLRNCGMTKVIPYEALLDTVTGLSGSGPAYVYMMIEALSDGGVRHGLDRTTAVELAAQTVMGAAKMVLMTDKHCGELKDAVTSPGGTTIVGVTSLEQSNFRYSVMTAVGSATMRAQELGRDGEMEKKNLKLY